MHFSKNKERDSQGKLQDSAKVPFEWYEYPLAFCPDLTQECSRKTKEQLSVKELLLRVSNRHKLFKVKKDCFRFMMQRYCYFFKYKIILNNFLPDTFATLHKKVGKSPINSLNVNALPN